MGIKWIGKHVWDFISLFRNTIDVSPGSAAGGAAVTVNNTDIDQVALDVNASNTTAHVVDITADAVTTGNVINISADGLSSGSAIQIDDAGSDTTERGIIDITQNHASAKFAYPIRIDCNGAQNCIKVDQDFANTAASTIAGYSYTLDKTGSSTSNNTMYGFLSTLTSDEATNGTNKLYGFHATSTLTHAADAGTTEVYGGSFTGIGGTNGTSTAYGIKAASTGADTNVGGWFQAADGGKDLLLTSSADNDDQFSIAVGTAGATTVTTVDDGGATAHLTFAVDGDVKFGGTSHTHGIRREVIALNNSSGAVDRTLTAAESGALITIDPSTDNTNTIKITLPTNATGLNYKFIVTADASNTAADVLFTSASASNDFRGHFLATNAGVEVVANACAFTLDMSVVPTVGATNWEVTADGTYWVITGFYTGTQAQIGISGDGLLLTNSTL